MLTIKVGKKRLKVLNLLLVLLLLIIIIYVIGKLIFLIPFFKKEYSYKINKENYMIDANATFKNGLFKCNQIETYNVKLIDKNIDESINRDLINNGFIKKRKNKYVRKTKNLGFCGKKYKAYKSEYSGNYVKFTLKGKNKVVAEVHGSYEDQYVVGKVGKNEKFNDIAMISNLNVNKIGTYVVSYILNVSNTHKEYLYRTITVVDSKKPDLELIGDKEININYGETYIEPGYKATDNYDGNLTNNVKVKNRVNTKKEGTYEISYTVVDSSGNKAKEIRKVIVKKEVKVIKTGPNIETKDGLTYVDGILIVNKKYSVPKDYNPDVNKEALDALKNMQADASVLGYDLSLLSGFRSYQTQETLYNNYVKKDGKEKADTYSAKPGYSEHQTGLAFDVGSLSSSFGNTPAGKWLEENCHLYGFIIRYPKDKIDITGYVYEPWHIRYLGVSNATKVKQSNLTLEEYLKIN